MAYFGRCLDCDAKHEAEQSDNCQCGGEVLPVPGLYYINADGEIHTVSRGGRDTLEELTDTRECDYELPSVKASGNDGAAHTVEDYHSRNFADTIEIYCGEIDEIVVALQTNYVRHCPMCGDSINVE